MDRAGIATAVLKPMLPARYTTSAQLREATAITLRAAADVTNAHPGRFAFHTPSSSTPRRSPAGRCGADSTSWGRWG